jgi:hypothetical protein
MEVEVSLLRFRELRQIGLRHSCTRIDLHVLAALFFNGVKLVNWA